MKYITLVAIVFILMYFGTRVAATDAVRSVMLHSSGAPVGPSSQKEVTDDAP